MLCIVLLARWFIKYLSVCWTWEDALRCVHEKWRVQLVRQWPASLARQSRGGAILGPRERRSAVVLVLDLNFSTIDFPSLFTGCHSGCPCEWSVSYLCWCLLCPAPAPAVSHWNWQLLLYEPDRERANRQQTALRSQPSDSTVFGADNPLLGETKNGKLIDVWVAGGGLQLLYLVTGAASEMKWQWRSQESLNIQILHQSHTEHALCFPVTAFVKQLCIITIMGHWSAFPLIHT